MHVFYYTKLFITNFRYKIPEKFSKSNKSYNTILYQLKYNKINQQMKLHHTIQPNSTYRQQYKIDSSSKLPSVNTTNLQYYNNPQKCDLAKSFYQWQRPRFNKDVINERNQLIVSSSRVSPQAPDFFRTTFNYYKKSMTPIKESKEDVNNYDVLNQKRMCSFNKRYEKYDYKKQRQSMDSRSNRMCKFSTLNWQPEIAQKIGSLNTRNYNIKKPILKIGKQEYVDTYSPF